MPAAPEPAAPEPAAPEPAATAAPDSGVLARGAARRFSLSFFLLALVALFVATPFLAEFPDGPLVEGVLITAVLSAAVLAVGTRPRTLLAATLLAVPAIAARWVSQYHPATVPPAGFLLPGLAFVAFVIFQLLRFILRAPRVDFQVLCAGAAGYLMLGLLWAFGYVLVSRAVPGALTVPGAAADAPLDGFNALYFSMVTLTTVGYGDVLPVAPVARMLAMLEAMVGTFYVTVLLARLVSLHASNPART